MWLLVLVFLCLLLFVCAVCLSCVLGARGGEFVLVEFVLLLVCIVCCGWWCVFVGWLVVVS